VGQDEGLASARAIEADEKMAADLAGPGYHIKRSNLLVLESKADMQKRGQSSLDDGDAMSLSFAKPVAPAEAEEEDEEEAFRPVHRQQWFWVDAMTPLDRDHPRPWEMFQHRVHAQSVAVWSM
jgi:hypothetical protein